MKQILQDYKSGRVWVEDVPAPAPKIGGVVVATRASLVSAGTERHMLSFGRASIVKKARDRPDLALQVLNKARTDGVVAAWQAAESRLEDWIPLGYSSSGVVVAVGEGVAKLKVGDRVACAGQGFASHSEQAWVPVNYAVPLPEEVDFADGAFATVGAIAIHGIHRSGVSPGESVVVIGLGLLGQLTVQALAAYGCAVVGVDVRREAVDRALASGAVAGAVSGVDDVSGVVRSHTRGLGADVAIVTAATPSSEPLSTAAAAARKGGRVCVVGVVGMEADRRVFYEKELSLVVAKSYGPGRDDPDYESRGIDYPPELSRWTAARNMEEFLRLVATGRMTMGPLIAERVRFEDAPSAYERLVAGKIQGGSILIEYDAPSASRARSVVVRAPAPRGSVTSPGVAVVGAGAFARTVLIPALSRSGTLERRCIVAAGGVHAAQAAKSFGFSRATTDLQDALADEEVHAVLVATRHNLHAPMVVDALSAGKNVFVEKPLGMSVADLARVARAAKESKGILQVGFNRRFAPLVTALRAHFDGRASPLLMTYTVNAGALPRAHWLRDPIEGGGRIVSEVCHFVDTLQSVAGAPPVRVFASGGAPNVEPDDHLAATVEFGDGSRGVIVYSGAGPQSLPKERLEVVGAGRAARMNNFRNLELFTGRRSTRRRALVQDKGHVAEFAAFFEAIRHGRRSPTPIEDVLLTSLATLAIRDSIASNRPIAVDLDVLEEVEGDG